VKLKAAKPAPLLIAVSAVVVVCVLYVLELDFLERIERMTFDHRVRDAARFSPPVATNLGFIYIDDRSIDFVRTNRTLGYRYGLYWPRQVYGRLVRELAAQNAKAVAFDVIFAELREDHFSSQVQMPDGTLLDSDQYFALQLRNAGNVVLADAKGLTPPDLFSTNALALGDISTDMTKDPDGVLRRANAFHVRTNWHSLFRQVEADPEFGVDLRRAQIRSNEIVLPRDPHEAIRIPLNLKGEFDLADFVGESLPEGTSRTSRPFTVERIWSMGIVLAARQLNLNLAEAEVDLRHGRIVLRNDAGDKRVLFVDEDGCFPIDWAVRLKDPYLFKQPIETLLIQERARARGETNLPSPWADKLVLVGSTAIGNDLSDRGATPLEKDTFLPSAHWNVANSVLTGRFIQRTSTPVDLAIIILLGAASAWVTWTRRILIASSCIVLMIVAYVAISWILFIDQRLWLPVVMPVAGGLLLSHVSLVTFRVMFEQAEQRRVKSIFSRIVSPNIVHELLDRKDWALGGARREVTVLFADIRGFTEFTDAHQERAENYAAAAGLAGTELEKYYDEQARETLATVNTYLALVADIVKKHEGTLDKYIGDCVMAFWGAPTPNPSHACACVKAAIEAQRCLSELNQRRQIENQQRESENAIRAAAGQPALTLLPVLTLGSGINTGIATVGLMGSEAHISNYTVFGREVNLASRLESLSGRGRILISGATFERLRRDDPALAATCISLPSEKVKGIRNAVRIFEVPWRTAEHPQVPAAGPSDTTRMTGDTSLLAAKNEASKG